MGRGDAVNRFLEDGIAVDVQAAGALDVHGVFLEESVQRPRSM